MKCKRPPKNMEAPVDPSALEKCYKSLEPKNGSPEKVLSDTINGEYLEASVFHFSDRFVPPKTKKHSDFKMPAVFPKNLLGLMPKSVSLEHAECVQDYGKKKRGGGCDCVCTTNLAQKMFLQSQTFFSSLPKVQRLVPDPIGPKNTFWLITPPEGKKYIGAKRFGHRFFGNELASRQAVSFLLCMLKGGYQIPVGINYWNNKASRTGANHWLYIYGYKFEEYGDGLKLTFLAHDEGRELSEKQHIELYVDVSGRIVKPGPHGVRPAVECGYEVVAVGKPYKIINSTPQS